MVSLFERLVLIFFIIYLFVSLFIIFYLVNELYKNDIKYCYVDYNNQLGVSHYCRHNQCDKNEYIVKVKNYLNIKNLD